MYGLADCNNFFVSCERVFRPDLQGKPVIVLSNNDGCAVARSNEAKALGIKMGVPLFQVRDIVEKHGVTVFSSNYALYGDMSNRVQTTLRQMVPAVEVYSIDEAFLDLRGLEHTDLDALAKNISSVCKRNTGIPVSVGIAPTKTLAKIASKLCKQYPKLRGGCYMHRPQDIEKVLRKFPIEDVWGIGRRYSKRLKAYGVNTAWDFTQLEPRWIQQEMGVVGMNIWNELRGKPSIEFETHIQDKQQICVSRSFSKEIYDFEALAEQVSLFTSMACEKLRKQKSACHYVLVFLLTNRHKESAPQHMEGRTIAFPVGTDSTLEINESVLKALRAMYKQGYGYKKAGAILSGIIPKASVMPDMFDTVDRQKHDHLMSVVDTINAKNGHSGVYFASQSLEGIRMNRQHLSQRFTTEWDEVITVKCL
ncbi:MAG: Y-family DNA polymerase [Bacteroidales bacterium]|nr:Y-family DNA polymerase [Bacteroidales bacterium]